MVASIQSLVPSDVPATKDLGTSAVSPPVKTAALLARVTPRNARRLTPSLSERRMLSNRFVSMATIMQNGGDASKRKRSGRRLHLRGGIGCWFCTQKETIGCCHAVVFVHRRFGF